MASVEDELSRQVDWETYMKDGNKNIQNNQNNQFCNMDGRWQQENINGRSSQAFQWKSNFAVLLQV